jgi:hypothetical protein
MHANASFMSYIPVAYTAEYQCWWAHRVAGMVTRSQFIKDFFIWEHLKTLEYKTIVETKADLLAHIQAACSDIQHTPGIFECT